MVFVRESVRASDISTNSKGICGVYKQGWKCTGGVSRRRRRTGMLER
jgi:hypothetical protein